MVSLGIFAAIVCASIAGTLLRGFLPAHHTDDASRDVIKIGMGLIATLSALVLGLLVASAKGSFSTKADEIQASAADIILLDHSLRQYGDETREIRALLKKVLESKVALKWVEEDDSADAAVPNSAPRARNIDEGQRMIAELSPTNEMQRAAQSQSLLRLQNLANTRWLLIAQKGSSIPTPFLVVLVFWFVVIFGSLSLLAPRNATVYAVIAVCALSVSSAIFLLLELDQPFDGLLRISDAPLRSAIIQVDQ